MDYAGEIMRYLMLLIFLGGCGTIEAYKIRSCADLCGGLENIDYMSMSLDTHCRCMDGNSHNVSDR